MKLRVLLYLIAGSIIAAAAGALVAAPSVVPTFAPAGPESPLPARLHDTGLYRDGPTSAVRDEHLAFSPQYPLWSDGATKRRWIHLPAGTTIDASRPDAWEFPRGTKLWKEFSDGRKIETRLIERLADGSWRYATYVWNETGTEATLAPEDGDVVQAGGRRYTIPSRTDCLACHEGPPVPVLGFSALQLSSDRDPLAPHAEPARSDHVDLRLLVARGLLTGLPSAVADAPPRIAAPTPTARAALGYLHANCGHCHNDAGALTGLELVLAQRVEAASGHGDALALVGSASRFRPHGAQSAQRIVAGNSDASVIALRMRSANPLARMPPLGVDIVDAEGVALVERWIHSLELSEATR